MKKKIKKILSVTLAFIMIIAGLQLTGVDLITTPNAKTISQYDVGDIIEFGSYPQSKVTDNELISKLNSLEKEWLSYGYYEGDENGNGVYYENWSTDYMKYADVTYNGNKYRAVEFLKYRPCNTYFGCLEGRSYQDDNGYYTDTIYWFKFEPLKWRILNPDEGLILCENIIDVQAYNNEIYGGGRLTYEEWLEIIEGEMNEYDFGADDNFGIEDDFGNDSFYINESFSERASHYPVSGIRNWLNNDFYNLCFDDNDKEKIQLSEVVTISPAQWFGDNFQYTTEDNIFLLSEDEVINENYGFSNDLSRQAQGTDYAKCQGLYTGVGEAITNGSCSWYLRSSYSQDSFSMMSVFGVELDGTISDCYEDDFINGVRPALKLNSDTSVAIKHFADGYNFETDRYDYNNWQLDFPVSLNAYKERFGPVKGELLYNMNSDSFCYGMAVTTATFLKYPEAISNFKSYNGHITDLFDLYIYDKNELFNLTAYDYILYGYLYQFDINVQKEEKDNENDITGLYEAVNQYVNGTGDPVIINFYNANGNKKTNGHTVVAIGLLEDDGKSYILTNDSSAHNTIQKLEINTESSEWEYIVYDDTGLWPDTIYHSYNSENDTISYNLPADDLYDLGLKNASGNTEFLSSLNNLIVSNKNIVTNCNLIEISPAKQGVEETISSTKYYWTEEQVDEIEITALEDDSTITVSDNNSSVSVVINNNENASFIVDDNTESSVVIDNVNENDVEILFTTTNCNGEEIDVIVSASANSEKVSATLTNESISISGVSNGDVALVKYDEIVETKQIDESNNEVEFDNKILASNHEYVNGVCTSCGGHKPIPQAMSSQIRFDRNDDGSYAETFDVRTRAKICDEDFTELVASTNEEAVNNIDKIGFVYTLDGENFSATSAQAVAQGEKVTGYIDAPVKYIQDADGYYMFTCLVTDIPETDKNYTLTAYAYICVNGKWYFSEEPINADFNSLYETYYPIACEKYDWNV